MANNSLLDFLQGASNAAASNVSAPVDGIAWLLRKAGIDVGDAPVGGSDWMRQRGLTVEPQNRLAGLLGESVGGVTPMVVAAKAPQIAQGLLQAERNLAKPRTLDPQAGMVRLSFGDIPENADDIAELAGKAWFRPINGLQKRVMSDVAAENLLTKTREDLTKKIFGHQSPNITYSTATAKQKNIVEGLLKENKTLNAFRDVSEEDQKREYIKKLIKTLSKDIGNVHKNENLTFKSIPLDSFKKGELLYKSPSYNRRQSSEYRLIVGDDGVPAYARKSNHFGTFTTNIYEGSDDAKRLGLVNGVDGYFDPFGRVGYNVHNWELVGDNTKTASKAGAISLNDLLTNMWRNGQAD